jgi:CubicO group peptidase (beta-lactamase class C family)
MKYILVPIFALTLLTTAAFSQDFNKAKMDSFFSILAEKNKAMGSFAISKNGKIIYSKAIGYAYTEGKDNVPATVKTKYRIGSITKMFTAVIIFQLMEEKKLSLDTRLSKYFPTVPNAATITISNLLNHRSGIHSFTDDSLYLSYNENPKTEAEMLGLIVNSTPDFEPGAKASYSNSNYVLLGYIAEKITKKLYGQLVQERIVSKLKLPDTYVGGKTNIKNNESFSYSLNFLNEWKQEPVTDMSIPGAAGSILSTPTDLIKFIEGLFAGKLVSADNLKLMSTIEDDYGMAMFEIPFYSKKALGHNGGIDGFSSILAYFPKDTVAFSYCTNGQLYPMNDITIGVLSIYFNKPYTIPTFASLALSSTDLDKYLGVYSSTEFPLKVTITKDNTTLVGQATGQAAFPMEATGKDIFKFDRAGIVMEFNPTKNELTLKQGGRTYLFTKEK